MPPSPTVCSARAMTAPTTSSSLAEMAATRAKSCSVEIGCATERRCSTSRATARSIPRLTRTGLPPEEIASMPARTMPCAITVAVVVPSPTMSFVLMAASLTSWAPMFSNWFFRWISRAMVTPSFVTTGDPVIFSRMTLRPLGPSVDLTASASWSTPDFSKSRAVGPKRSSLAIGAPPAGLLPMLSALRDVMASRSADNSGWVGQGRATRSKSRNSAASSGLANMIVRSSSWIMRP